MVKEGRTLAGSLFLFATKDQWASISALSVDTGLRKERPAGWINTDEKWLRRNNNSDRGGDD